MSLGEHHEPAGPHLEVNPELRAAFKTLAASLPAGTPIPVPAEQLLALLDGEPGPGTASQVVAELLTVEQVAARLRCGKQFVYRHSRSLGGVKVGRSVRFPSAAVERYVARRSLHRTGPS
jgi:excisionase family DNA binding protein